MLFDTFTPFDRPGRDLFSMDNGVLDWPFATSVATYRDGDRYIIEAELPGADPESVDVTVEGQSLSIRAERSSAAKNRADDAPWLVHERADWSFVRRFTMSDIDPDGIHADYRDGVLTVVAPIARGTQGRKVPVQVGSRTSRPAMGAGRRKAAETRKLWKNPFRKQQHAEVAR